MFEDIQDMNLGSRLRGQGWFGGPGSGSEVESREIASQPGSGSGKRLCSSY